MVPLPLGNKSLNFPWEPRPHSWSTQFGWVEAASTLGSRRGTREPVRASLSSHVSYPSAEGIPYRPAEAGLCCDLAPD